MGQGDIMRCVTDPEAHHDMWLTRFLRLVLTHRPALRFRLDHTRIDELYKACPDPVDAGCQYLREV